MSSVATFFSRDPLSKLILRATVGTLLAMQGILAFGDLPTRQQLARAMCFLFGCEGPAAHAGIWGGLVATLTTLGGFCVLVGFYFRTVCAVLFFIALSQVVFRRHGGLPYTDFGILYHVVLCGVSLSSVFTSPGKWSADGEGSSGKNTSPAKSRPQGS